MRRIFALMAMMLLLTGSIAAGAPAGDLGRTDGSDALEGHALPAGNDTGRPVAVSDGLYWMDDRRLTNNGGADGFPALAVDSSGNGYVSYYRGGNLYFLKVDRYGNQLFEEKTVAAATVPVQHCGQPTERIGRDAQDNIHLLWSTHDNFGPVYQKFASNANPLTQPIDLSKGNEPEGMGLAVGTNNRAYFAYGNWTKSTIEMEYIDQNLNLHTGYLAASSGAGVTIGVDRNSSPYVFFRNGTYGGLTFTTFDAGGSLQQSPTNVSTPFNDPALPMPALAFGPDGAVHLLQASSASGVRSLYYTKLAPDGTKLTNDIEITNSSGDFGDICVDGKRNVVIVWGDENDGKLHYVRIQPNLENATFTPVKVTGNNGTDRDPQITVGPEGSLHVAWVSDRDGNMEIYYKFAFSYGVELGMAPEEMAKIIYVHSNETRSANITVRNNGGENDTMYLGVGADFYGKEGGFGKNYTGPGFKIWIDDRNKVLDLEAQQIVKVPVFVRGARSGQPNDYIKVTINATSKMNPGRTDTIEFRVYLIIDQRILLKCPDHVRITSAGEATQFSIGICDLGDLWENINLSAMGPDQWDFRLDFDKVRLKPGDLCEVKLNVTPPADAMGDDSCIVRVRAVSADNPAVSSEVETRTIVAAYMLVDIRPDRTELLVLPGVMADCTLTVENHGNIDRPVTFNLRVEYGDSGWNAWTDTDALSLRSEESWVVVLHVAAPPGAPAGSRLDVKVTCIDLENEHFFSCNVTAVVGRVRDLEVSVAPGEVTLLPGGTAVYSIDILNTGNGQDEIGAGGFVLPSGWDLSLSLPNGRPLGEDWNFSVAGGSS
jgi:uncharacterized membrane protein